MLLTLLCIFVNTVLFMNEQKERVKSVQCRLLFIDITWRDNVFSPVNVLRGKKKDSNWILSKDIDVCTQM